MNQARHSQTDKRGYAIAPQDDSRVELPTEEHNAAEAYPTKFAHVDESQVAQPTYPIQTHSKTEEIKPSSSQRRPNDGRSRGLLNAWWAEILSCLLMVVMLAAIVATLLPYTGRPLPTLPYRLSINTLVSLWSTILKTAALFVLAEGISQLKWNWVVKSRPLVHFERYDAASRGPWGCFRLMITPGFRDAVAALGCIMAILTLAVDPFSQQLIYHFPCREALDTGNATIPRSSIYDEVGNRQGAGRWSVTIPVMSAIEAGIFTPSNIQVPFDCPGDCTFANLYSMVGYCSECSDVSDEIETFWTNSTATRPVVNGGFVNVSSSFVNSTLPSGLFAAFSQSTSNDTWFAIGANTVDEAWVDVEMIMAASSFNATFRSAYWLPLLSHGCQSDWANATWGCSGRARAARCRLGPCVKTYSTQIQGGRIEETLVATSNDFLYGRAAQVNGSSPFNYTYSIANIKDCATSEQKQKLRQRGYVFDDSQTWLAYNVSIGPNDKLIQMTDSLNRAGADPIDDEMLAILPPDCIYQILWRSTTAIAQYMRSYFSTAIRPYSNGLDYYGDARTLKIFNGSYVTLESIDTTFKNIADSLSLHIRQYEPSGYSSAVANAPAQGTIWVTQSCIGVRWAWIAFPCAVTAFTILFFLCMLGETELNRDVAAVRGWKSSMLPLVFHRFGGVDTNMGEPQQIDAMERQARNVKIHVEGHAKG